ncbi:alanine--glyoxylate aminotransferase family protein [soil metagenome]
MQSLFRLPGPTPLPPSVLAAMQRPMIAHRSSEFRTFYRGLLDRLRRVHRTDGDVLLWPGSGSAGWEIAIANLINQGDPVLIAVCGDFGDRFARVAIALGADVRRVDAPWGQAITPDILRQGLNQHPDVVAVLLTHNETSTGVTNPLKELASEVRSHGALVLVDAVSSAAGLPLEVDGWGLDFVLSGSQKAWMSPPGVVIVAVGERVWAAQRRCTNPLYFWSIADARDAALNGSTTTTPPLSTLYALDAASRMIESESVDEVWKRHQVVGNRTRAGLADLGLEVFADQTYASNTVTAFYPPSRDSAKPIVDAMFQEHGVTIAGGQGHLADAILRIGHMGWVNLDDIDACLGALALTLSARSKESAA